MNLSFLTQLWTLSSLAVVILTLPTPSKKEIGTSPVLNRRRSKWLTSPVPRIKLTSEKPIQYQGQAKQNSSGRKKGRKGSRAPVLKKSRPGFKCAIPADIPERVSQLNSFLNASQYIGISPLQPRYKGPPLNQPKTCPEDDGSWWPRKEDNLKSTCPWTYATVDLGESFYPRYLQDAECLCTTCVMSNSMGCVKLRQQVTVFQRGPCKDGVAVMTATKRAITVGCFCAGAPALPPSPGPTE